MRLSKFATEDGYQRPPCGVIVSQPFGSLEIASRVTAAAYVLHHHREVMSTLVYIGLHLSNGRTGASASRPLRRSGCLYI
jgi:hypothetical protein